MRAVPHPLLLGILHAVKEVLCKEDFLLKRQIRREVRGPKC